VSFSQTFLPVAASSDAAVHDVTTALVPELAVDLRIERPDALAGTRVDGVHDAPRRRLVHDAVDDDRCRFHAARGFEIVAPDQAEAFDVVSRNLVELRKARLGIVQADRRPVVGCRGIGLDVGAVDRGYGGLDAVRRQALCGILRV